MKTNKSLTIALFLLLSVITIQGQEQVVENSESVIIMNEDDIISLVKTLREYKKIKSRTISLSAPETSKIKTNAKEKDSYEVAYLRNQISQLENLIERYNNYRTTSNTGSEYDSNNINRRELNNIKYEINQLKNLIRQLVDRTNSDHTVVVPSNELETAKESPKEAIIKDQPRSNSEANMALENKLDSLNMMFKNLKPSENPDYSNDFIAIEKRMEELKKDLVLKNTQPNTYETLVSQYKGFSKNIYFSNNSIVLKIEGNQVVEELYEILDKNDNIDIVIKGFASNKGNALYNENLSMQRTEAVKKALILRGVHPTRVLTQYHGIDYIAETEKARRVEISILVRK